MPSSSSFEERVGLNKKNSTYEDLAPTRNVDNSEDLCPFPKDPKSGGQMTPNLRR